MDRPHKRRRASWLILLFLLAFPVYAQAPEAPQNTEIQSLQQNTLRPISTTNYQQKRVLGAISEDIWNGLKYRTIIKCLAKHESGYRTDVYGDNGLAYGILQFHRPTFNRFCTGNYYSARDQITCCDEMLSRDFDRSIKHWTTYPLCYTME